MCYLTHRFPHLTETFIVREMTGLAAHGVDVTILSLMAPRTSGAPDSVEELLPRVTYARSLSWSVVRANLRWLGRNPVGYARAIRGLVDKTWREPRVLLLCLALFPRMAFFARVASEADVDHVRAHFAWIEGIAAGVMRDLTGIGFSVNPHAFGLFTRPPADVRPLLEEAELVTTISDYNRRYIAGIAPRLRREVEVVRCGVDLDRYELRPAERAAGPLRIVSIGRAVEKKGHDVLLRACGVLRQRGLEFDCRIVVGGGGLRAELDELHAELDLAGSVQLLDSMPESEVRGLLRWADVFALACRVARSGDRDGIPVVLMEAMAVGLPVVTTDVSGLPELVEDGVQGAVVPPEDPVALADAIMAIGSDPERRAAMGRSGRAKVAAGFRIEPNVERLLHLIESVVQEGAEGAVQ